MRDYTGTLAGRRFGTHCRQALALGIAGLFVVTACDKLVQVDAPSRVIASGLEDPSQADLLTNSVGADFECAFAHYIVGQGLVGNELEISTGLIVLKEYDRRDFKTFGSSYSSVLCEDGTNVGIYKPLSIARWDGDHLLGLLEKWTDAQVTNRQVKIATAALYTGYSLVLLGESMCSAAIDVGPEMTPAQLFAAAEERFTKSIAAATLAGNTTILNAARVGRARALLRQGKKAAAGADARLVPDGFTFNATYSSDSPRRENGIWTRNQRSQVFTIDPSYRGMSFAGVPDPRVALTDQKRFAAGDGRTPLWTTNKYPTVTTPIPLASWREARLIVAEADGGQSAVTQINVLHTAAGLPAFNSTDPATIASQILYERKAELFLESHGLGDIRQYGIPLTPAPGTVFKDGSGTYTNQVCFPLPDVERLNNPNIKG
jgi:starch-binding outer membrane protein, SusD/RagB family